MNQNRITRKQKIKAFFKRNSYALVVACSALILAFSLVMTVIARSRLAYMENLENSENIENVKPNEEVQESSTTPVVFVYPVKDYTMGNTFTDSEMVYNATLNEYTTHQGIDFIVKEGTEVVACYDGTIESVSYDTLTGTAVVIDHGNGLKTSYMSLSSDVQVNVGDKVKTGQLIGYASSSAGGESGLGAHLHLEAMENGKQINPMTYLGEK